MKATDTHDTIQGQCHCGDIQWRTHMPPKLLINCHCNMCRQLSGADYSSWVLLPAEHFQIQQGQAQLQQYPATDQFDKSFCQRCGSTVYCVNRDKFPEFIYVARGNITTEIELAVNIQVYTDDKAPWVTLDPNIPIYQP